MTVRTENRGRTTSCRWDDRSQIGAYAGDRTASDAAHIDRPAHEADRTWMGAAATLGKFCAAVMVPGRRGVCGRPRSGQVLRRREAGRRPGATW
jgi:hypothetical protein